MTSPAPQKAQLTPSSDKTPVEVSVDEFKITDIPDVMTKMGWTQAARLMQRWFDGQSYEMAVDEKEGLLDVKAISKEKFFDDLEFDWLISSSQHTGEVVKDLFLKVTNPSQYNEFIGRRKGLTQLAPGLLQFMARLKILGVLDEGNKDLKRGMYDYSTLSAKELEVTTQYNFKSIGISAWEKITNPLDDVYGTLGGFVIKFAVTKFTTTSKTKLAPATLRVDEVGCYIRDTYEFLNESSKDQFLGYWSSEGVVKPGPIAFLQKPEAYESGGKLYYKVTNDSYNRYRAENGKGGDLFVYSTVKRLKTSILLRFTEGDFSEFTERSVKPKTA